MQELYTYIISSAHLFLSDQEQAFSQLKKKPEQSMKVLRNI